MPDNQMKRLGAALEGRYRIERELGEGGMATVYLAEDLKHHRQVALKVLKPQLAAVVGAERFLAEIEVTANLQHPRILPLYDSGEADSYLYYVMPFVEGETLRVRLDRERQLSLEDALRMADGIAAAIQHAHRHGVVHRDIKPANILLQDGEPVVADFGIALAVGSGGAERLTETGASVGTPHYMSPEQATGDTFVGPAADIYALGCVLYEMLVGEPPYTGASTQAILGKIITSQPVPAIEERPAVPLNVDAAIRRALEKVPADRFGSAADMAAALKDEGFRHGRPAAARREGAWKPIALAALAAVAVLAMAFTWSWTRKAPDTRAATTRLRVSMAEGEEIRGSLAISPDGSTWAYVGPGDGENRLWVKRRSESRATPLAGTEGADYPFFSPDGRWIGFVAGIDLRKIGVDGSGAVTLSSSTVVVHDWGFGAAWLSSGYIVFPGEGDALRRISDVGGATEPLLTVDDLPDRARVFLAVPTGDPRFVVVTAVAPGGGITTSWLLDVTDGSVQQLAPSSVAIGVTSGGHLLYTTPQGTVYAARLTLGHEAGLGPSVPLLEEVQGAAWSASGDLLYLESIGEPSRTLLWVDRDGGSEEVDPTWSADIGSLALSPDGRQLAVAIRNDEGQDLWVKQLDRGPTTRLTSSVGLDRRPAWSADGQRVLFPSDRGETRSLYVARADGVGEPELVLGLDVQIDQGLLSPGDEWLIYRVGATAGVRDIFAKRLSGDSITIAVSAEPVADEDSPAISPDGGWIAYVSNESGTAEVYVRPFPNVRDQRVQVSSGGGRAPVWGPDGIELFYEAGGTLISAFVSTSPRFSVDSTVAVFPRGNFLLDNRHALYDVTSDGRFILAREDQANARADLVLIQGFLAEIEEKLRD